MQTYSSLRLPNFKNKVFHNFDEVKREIGNMDKKFASSGNKNVCYKENNYKIKE